MKYLRYLKYLALHKWYVFRVGLITKAPLWRLIIHDWSKFSVAEFAPYAEWFYGERNDTSKLAYSKAWLHHLHRNPHHWNHWAFPPPGNDPPVQMPEHFVREMVADWYAAGRAQGAKWDAMRWYNRHKPGMYGGLQLHPVTQTLVEILLDDCEFHLNNS